MTGGGPALRLQIFVGEEDTWQHRPVYHEIVRRAREAGLAGATVLRGIEGFGGRSIVHTDRLVDLAGDLPVVVVIVDAEDRVRAFLPRLHEVIGDGICVLDDVEVLHYQVKAPR